MFCNGVMIFCDFPRPLKGAKIQTSALLLLVLQRLTRDAVRFTLTGQGAAFQADIKFVDENLQAES